MSESKTKTVLLCKADPITRPVESVIIDISRELPKSHFKECTIDEMVSFYNYEVEKLANALFDSLPQATLHKLLTYLMAKTFTLYGGPQEPKEIYKGRKIKIDYKEHSLEINITDFKDRAVFHLYPKGGAEIKQPTNANDWYQLIFKKDKTCQKPK